MTEQTFLSRIGRWFKRDGDSAIDGAIDNGDGRSLIGDHGDRHLSSSLDTRTTFLRPWAKRDAAIQQLQDGFTTLTDLMSAIRDNLENQNQRQNELMGALQQLPQLLESLPENHRVQSETLKAICQQIESQSSQQERLSQVLSRIGDNTGEQKQMVDALRNRVEDLHKSDTTIADYLNNVGSALKDVSKSNETSAQVLGQMRDHQSARDTELQTALHRQGTRFTTMLAAAIFLSIAALVAVCVMGYLMINYPKH